MLHAALMYMFGRNLLHGLALMQAFNNTERELSSSILRQETGNTANAGVYSL